MSDDDSHSTSAKPAETLAAVIKKVEQVKEQKFAATYRVHIQEIIKNRYVSFTLKLGNVSLEWISSGHDVNKAVRILLAVLEGMHEHDEAYDPQESVGYDPSVR